MIRVGRSKLTRSEIIRVAANRFLKDGYAATTVSSMAKALNMSTGNVTFHFPTKEHMLAELVDMLCRFQWKMMETEARDGHSSVMAICLELLSMASACEQDAIAKDFFISSYTSPLCLEIIRKNDAERSKQVYKKYCPDWTDERFEAAEMLVYGIEYATLMTAGGSPPLEHRIAVALDAILDIYNVPKDLRTQKINRVISMDYQNLGLRVLEEFRAYVDKTTEQALEDLYKAKGLDMPAQKNRKERGFASSYISPEEENT